MTVWASIMMGKEPYYGTCFGASRKQEPSRGKIRKTPRTRAGERREVDVKNFQDNIAVSAVS